MTPESFDPQWLQWARKLQAIAQIGLTYAQTHYDSERYEQVRDIAAQMLAAGSGAPMPRILDLFAAESGYTTPKIDVRGVVFRDNAILLVKELMDGGRWTLPGGWADVNDSPGEAAVREIREESGFQTRALRLLAVYDRSKHPHVPPHPNSVYKIFILCEITGGAATTSAETGGAAFFAESDIPELSTARVTRQQIARMFAYHYHPELPADFD